MNYMEIRNLLERHQNSDLELVLAQGGKNDIHYARMTGFLMSTVVSMMRDLPEDRQTFHREIIEQAALHNQKAATMARLKEAA
jgi:hypothetical protein